MAFPLVRTFLWAGNVIYCTVVAVVATAGTVGTAIACSNGPSQLWRQDVALGCSFSADLEWAETVNSFPIQFHVPSIAATNIPETAIHGPGAALHAVFVAPHGMALSMFRLIEEGFSVVVGVLHATTTTTTT